MVKKINDHFSYHNISVNKLHQQSLQMLWKCNCT